jgi:hypothetical protein
MSPWLIAFAIYLAVGLTLVFVGPAARMRRQEVRRVESQALQLPRWKPPAFSGAIALAIILLWPALAVSAARIERARPTTVWDALQTMTEFRKLQQLHEAMSEGGVDADEMPNGSGEFGLVPSNPIPCKSTFGSTSYLAGLRTPDGTKVVYERSGSFASDVSPYPVDAYMISLPNGQKLATIYISPYQKRISCKAPRGFILAGTSFN